MCGGGPPPGTSCDSTALTTPPVSRPWMRMTIGMPRTFIFLPPSDGIWIGFINIGLMLCRPAPAGKIAYGLTAFLREKEAAALVEARNSVVAGSGHKRRDNNQTKV